MISQLSASFIRIGTALMGQSMCQQRRFASRLVNSPGARRKDNSLGGDKRYQVIKDVLYGESQKGKGGVALTEQQQRQMLEQQDKTRFSSHEELVERMWSLVKEREAKEISDDLARKYRCMRAAMEELKATDERLFKGTGAVDPPSTTEVTLFPRQLRIPTETPPTTEIKK